MKDIRIFASSMPPRIQTLPLDERGYPIPWFVGELNGKKDFRVMDIHKWHRAIREKLCWVCGSPLGVNMVFVAGCMCGVNCTSSEPPCHYDCALWSALNCPFLSNPEMVRREDAVVNNETCRESAPGFAITRNPGVAMLWVTREYEVFPDGRGGRLIQMGKPRRVEWYKEGRPATRAEVQASIDTGLPALEALARQEKGGLAHLQKAVERFQPYLPKE
jgi:hypothetical protein